MAAGSPLTGAADVTRYRSIAQMAAWVLLRAPVFRRMLFKWTFTVDSEMFSVAAITLFDWPLTRQRKIAISRSDSLPCNIGTGVCESPILLARPDRSEARRDGNTFSPALTSFKLSASALREMFFKRNPNAPAA